ENDVEIARLTSRDPGFAVADRAQPRPRVDPRRDAHVDLRRARLPPFAVAGRAGFLNLRPRPAAGRTGLSKRNDAATTPHLTHAAAGRTGDTLGAGFGPAAVAAFAGHRLAEGQLLLDALRRLLERDLQIVTQVGAIVAATRAATAAAAEHLLEAATAATATSAEDFAENIERVVEATAHAAGTTRSPGPRPFKRRVTIAIVGGTLFRILQHLVGVRDLLEFLLGCLVARVFVRVILHRL